jgi:hypothetical protein
MGAPIHCWNAGLSIDALNRIGPEAKSIFGADESPASPGTATAESMQLADEKERRT